MQRIDGKPNYMTVPAAIRELEKIEMDRRNNGKYKLDHVVTKKQKIILSSFGMDETSIREEATIISNLLSSNQSLIVDDELAKLKAKEDAFSVTFMQSSE